MANLTVSKVFVGRLVQVIINDSSDTEKINWSNLKPESVTVSDELKESVTEIEDGAEIVTAYGFKSSLEMTVSHLDPTEFDGIDDCEDLGEVVIKTTTGGTNSTGMTFTMTDCDQIRAFADGFKTKIVAKKSSSSATRPWTIAHNSA
jgi:hypothetical protein